MASAERIQPVNTGDHAIVVGIDLYPGIAPLEGAQKDAESFADWLVAPDGGGLPPGNVRTILTSQYHPPPPARPAAADPNAQRFNAAILDLLTDASGSPRAFPVGRRLYLYFSGHGFQGSSEWEEAALYAANATRILPEHIPGTRVANAVKAAAAFEEIVLIMDCCRDVTLTGRISEPLLCLLPNVPRAAAVRTCYAYAVPRGSQARERQIVPGGPVQGVFTYVLLDALHRTPGDGNGHVTGQAIKNYIHNIWPDVALGNDGPRIEVDNVNDIVFAVRPSGPPVSAGGAATVQPQTQVTVSIDPPVPHGTQLVIMDGKLQEILRLPISGKAVSCSLTPGLYKACLDGMSREEFFQAIGAEIHVQL